MEAKAIVGTWRLVSFHLESADGQISYPWGRDVVGFLNYTDRGRMSVALMKSERPRHASEDWWGGTVEERVAAYDTFIGYAGTYELQGDEMIHHVEVCLFPNYVGTDLVRQLQLEGDRLSLVTPPIPALGVTRSAYLVWERV